jgi:hypothetical protein
MSLRRSALLGAAQAVAVTVASSHNAGQPLKFRAIRDTPLARIVQ